MLEAHGGAIAKLTAFASDGSLESYRYAATSVNLVPNPEASLTPYNSLLKGVPVGERCGESVGRVKPYANLCGIVALPRGGLEQIQVVRAAVAAAQAAHRPEYS